MNTENRIVYLLQEIAIVVIGVLIAVSINNYKERIDNENYIEKTLLAIEKEIKGSQSDMDTVLNRHLAVLDFLAENIEGNDQTLAEMIGGQGGIQSAALKNISLRFFISNKAELVDFNLISQLSDIEYNTGLLSGKMERLANFAYEHINERDEEIKLKFAYLLAEVIDSEENLLELYAAFLQENEAYLRQHGENR